MFGNSALAAPPPLPFQAAEEGGGDDDVLKALESRDAAARWKQRSEELRKQRELRARDFPPAPADLRDQIPSLNDDTPPLRTSPLNGRKTSPGIFPHGGSRIRARSTNLTQPRIPGSPAGDAKSGDNAEVIAPGDKSAQSIVQPFERMRSVKEIMPFADYAPDERAATPDDTKLKKDLGWVDISKEPYQPRLHPEIVFSWEASNLYSNPLYFEDPALERYGHTCWCDAVQPFVSAGRFGAQLAGLPYQMTIDPACKQVYSLGWYRPGECAPKKCYQIPWNTEAAIVQGAAATGMVFLIP